MSTRQKRDKEKNNGVRGFVFTSVSFIVICAALVLGMSVFFRVSNIEVVGADRYTKDEIVSASGIKDGDNLVFINRTAISERLYAKLMYIGDITIKRKLPNTVVIDISESGPIAVLESDSGLWLVDRNCRLAEQCQTQDAENYIKIIGLSGVNAKKGEIVSVEDEDKPKKDFVIAILSALTDKNMTGDVSSIDVSNVSNAELEYLDGRFVVKLGLNEKIEYKIGLLLGTVEKLDAKDTGSIDLAQDKKAQFSPF